MDEYMANLKRLNGLNPKKLFLSHSLQMTPEAIEVDAKSKVESYIKHREKIEEEMKRALREDKQLDTRELF